MPRRSRLASLLLAALLSLSVVACNGGTETEEGTDTEATEGTEATEDTATETES